MWREFSYLPMFDSGAGGNLYDVAIVGAGPVGLFAITSCGMLGMKSVCIENMPLVGGQCAALYPEKRMYGIPGMVNEVGDEFVGRLADQANEFDPKFLLGHELKSIIKTPEGHFVLRTSNADVLAKAVIVASGGGLFTPNKPPLEGIEDFEGKSVFYSVEDKNIFADKVVCVAGGGDSAVDWCLELANVARKVLLVHRRDKFRCAPRKEELLRDLAEAGLVEIKTPFQLHSIDGDREAGAMSRLGLIGSDDAVEYVSADYLLPFFGLVSKGASFNMPDVVFTSDNKIAVDYAGMSSSVSGIFAIGDACYYEGKLFVIVSGFCESVRAANGVYKYINPEGRGNIANAIIKR